MQTRHLAAAALTAGLTALLAAPLAAQEAAADSDSASAVNAVQELRDQYFAKYKAEAAAEAAALFVEDGAIMPQASAMRVGREQVEQHLSSFFENQDISVSGLSDATLYFGDRVLDRGILSVEVSPEESEESSSDTGKYVLLASSADGEWKIEWLIWNLDHPLRTSGGEE